jgi:hypothetical protein
MGPEQNPETTWVIVPTESEEELLRDLLDSRPPCARSSDRAHRYGRPSPASSQPLVSGQASEAR